MTATFAAALTVTTLAQDTLPRVLLATTIAIASVIATHRHAISRVRLDDMLTGLAVAVPGLAVIGPALALPAAPGLFGFRIALAAAALLLVGRALLAPLRASIRPPRPWVLLVFWYGWAAATMVWAANKAAALHSIAVLLTMLVLVACTGVCGRHRRTYGRMLVCLGGTLALTLLLGVGEIASGMHLPGSAEVLRSTDRAATAWFVNSNNLATYLAICWPFILLGGLSTRRRAWRALAAAALATEGALILLNGSRTSLGSIAIATVACAFAVPRIHPNRSARALWIAIGAILVVLTGILIAASSTDSSLLRQFRLTSAAEEVQTNTGSGGARLDVARAGLRAVSRSYLLGVGAGNAESAIRTLNDHDLEVENLHCWWLEVLVTTGVPGLALFLGAYGGLLVGCALTIRQSHSPLERTMAAATVAALLSFLIGAFGPSTSAGFTPMWLLLGIGGATLLRAERSAADTMSLREGCHAASPVTSPGHLRRYQGSCMPNRHCPPTRRGPAVP